MADLQLQPSIATDTRSQALLNLIGRLKDPTQGGTLDISSILVYRMGSLVDSAVLPMAWQWDVLNPLFVPVASQLVELEYADWDQIADTDTLNQFDVLQYLTQQTGPTPTPPALLYAQYRALILLSTQLHSIMGTPASLQRALSGLGYPSAVIQEGQHSWGGTTWPASEGWAAFRVLINIASIPPGTNIATVLSQVTAIANFWKPARCWLDSVQFYLGLSDALIPGLGDTLASIFQQQDTLAPLPGDFIVAPFFVLIDTKTVNPYWNNQYQHTSITYGQNEPAVAEGALVVNGNAISH